MIEEGLDAPVDSDLYKYASKLNNKKNISDAEAGKLYAFAAEHKKNNDSFYESLDATEAIVKDSDKPFETETARKMTDESESYSKIARLIDEGESNSYIADKLIELDGSISKEES